MKEPYKGIVVIILIFGSFFGAMWLGVRSAIRKYNGCDHESLLAACRVMIANRDSYTNSPNWKPSEFWQSDEVRLTRERLPYGNDIPHDIRILNPLFIAIRTNNVLIADPPRLLPMRRAVLAFAPDVKTQYGTRKYVDGLWFWNGNFESDEMRDRVYGKNTK